MTDKIDLEALAASGFTPGPWRYEHLTDTIVDPKGDEVVEIRLVDVGPTDAHLIAAAPELLQRAIAAEERADRAEAEVERLNALLDQSNKEGYMTHKKPTLSGGIASTMFSGMRVREATEGELVTVKEGEDFVTRPIKPDEAFMQPNGELLCGCDAYNQLKFDTSVRDLP